MRLTLHQNLSDRIAVDIEKRIRNGTFIPDRKMPSVREFAAYYNVSIQAINTAIEKLRTAELVTVKSRIGLFVNPKYLLPVQKKIVVLRKQDPGPGYHYLENLLQFYDPEIYPGVQFQSRFLPRGEFVSSPLKSMSYNTVFLNYELDQIEAAPPDCLLVFLTHLKREDVKRIVSFPFPAVFVGDFERGDFPGIAYNSIRECTRERGEALIRTAVNAGGKQICICGGGLKTHYVKKVWEGALKIAKETGAALHYVEASPGYLKSEMLESYWEEILVKIEQESHPDTIVLDTMMEIPSFHRSLKKMSARTGRSIRLVANTERFLSNTIVVTEDYSAFAQRAGMLIFSLMNENKAFGIVEISGAIHREAVQIGPEIRLEV